MERDNSIFLMGEEVAEYNGAYKVSKERQLVLSALSTLPFLRVVLPVWGSEQQWSNAPHHQIYDLELLACRL